MTDVATFRLAYYHILVTWMGGKRQCYATMNIDKQVVDNVWDIIPLMSWHVGAIAAMYPGSTSPTAQWCCNLVDREYELND